MSKADADLKQLPGTLGVYIKDAESLISTAAEATSSFLYREIVIKAVAIISLDFYKTL